MQCELQYDHLVEIWNQNSVLGLGMATIETFEDVVETYDFSMFIFTPADKVIKQVQETNDSRENVIFEFGLFIGRLSR